MSHGYKKLLFFLCLFLGLGPGDLRSQQGEPFGFDGLTTDTVLLPVEESAAAGLVTQTKPEEPCRISDLLRESHPDLPGGVCKRIVCGPYFWHNSATDLCRAPEEMTETEGDTTFRYHAAFFRRPARVNSREPWMEVRIPVERGTLDCGTYGIQPEARRADLWELLLPTAFAEGEPFEYPWSNAERETVGADILEAIRGNLEAHVVAEAATDWEAAGMEDPWAVNPTFRLYMENAYLTIRFLQHALVPERYPCPDCLTGLCLLTDGRFTPLWTDFGCPADYPWCGIAVTSALDTIAFNRLLSPAASAESGFPPEFTFTVIAIMAIHETYHVIHHWLNGTYQPDNAAALLLGEFRTDLSDDPVLNFEDEMSARAAESIAYMVSGLDASLARGINAVSVHLMQLLQTFLGMRNNSAFSGEGVIPNSYATVFYKGTVTRELEEAILDCMEERDFDWNNQYEYRRNWDECFTHVFNLYDQQAVIQRLQDALRNRGGPMEFCPAGLGDNLAALRRHSSLHRDALDSEDVDSGPGGGEEGPMPEEGLDIAEPEPIGSSEREDYLPPECVGVPFGDVERRCFDWCWDHFPTGQDGYICQQLTNYDIARDCARSSLRSGCAEEAEARRRRAEEEAERQRREEEERASEAAARVEYGFECPNSWYTTARIVLRGDEIEVFTLDTQGRITMDALQTRLLEEYVRFNDGCDPYVGPARCCNFSPTDRICFPNGNNFACEAGNACGCPLFGGVFEGCCTHPDDGARNAHQCTFTTEGCFCLRHEACF